MRFQEQKFSCGAAAIRNVLKCFGINLGEHRLRLIAGTDEQGTDEEGVVGALEALGFKVVIHETNLVGEAKKLVAKAVKAEQPLIIAVDKDTHWAAIVGMLGGRYVIVDSERTVKNKKENGVHVIGTRELFRRWRKPNGTMYGISVSK